MQEPAPVITAIWFWRSGMDVSSAFELSLQTNSKCQGRKRKALPGAGLRSARCPMESQLWGWKPALERIWSAPAPDYHAAACLVAAIAGASEEAILRQAPAIAATRHAAA